MIRKKTFYLDILEFFIHFFHAAVLNVTEAEVAIQVGQVVNRLFLSLLNTIIGSTLGIIFLLL